MWCFQDVIKFWLDRGVDGIRLDTVKYLYEVDDLSLDEPLSDEPSMQVPNEYEYLNHICTTHQPATFDVKSWRTILDQYSGIMITWPS